MSQPDAVLIVGAGPLQLHAIRTACDLGLLPLVTDRDPHAPGIALAELWYPCDTYNVQGHKALMAIIQRDFTLRGVMTAGADVAPSVAAAAARAHTPGIPLSVARRTHDKARVHYQLLHAGMDAYLPLSLHVSLKKWALFAITMLDIDLWIMGTPQKYPVVLKPLSQSASRGISIVQNHHALPAAVAKAAAFGDYLVQECVTGSEHSAEMILGNAGELLWFNVVDRVFRYDQGIPLEIGHINPSRLSAGQVHGIQIMLHLAAKALGVQWGPFKADIMMTDDGVKILECTARLSGGYDSQGTSLARGLDPTRILMQLACRLPLDAPRHDNGAYAACCAAFPAPGKVMACPDTIAEHLKSEGLTYAVHVLRQAGETIEPYTHCATRPGFVISTGETYEQAWGYALNGAEELAQGWSMEQQA